MTGKDIQGWRPEETQFLVQWSQRTVMIEVIELEMLSRVEPKHLLGRAGRQGAVPPNGSIAGEY